MSIDKEKLKLAAEAARDFKDSGVEPGTFNPYEYEFIGLASPETVLGLLEEVDREVAWSRFATQVSNQWSQRWHVLIDQHTEARSEIDRLKSELGDLVNVVSDLGGKHDEPGWINLWKGRDKARAYLESSMAKEKSK